MSEQKRPRLEGEKREDLVLKQTVTCPICLGIFKQPVILPSCGHSFCLACIKQVADNETKVRCPECRAKSKLGDRGVNGLLKNFLARQVAELVTESSSSTSNPGNKSKTLSLHSNCNHVATQKEHCAHCDSTFCASCVVAHIELLKMSASWISSQFSSRYAEALETRDESFENARMKIAVENQDVKARIETESEALLQKLRDVAQCRKEELFHEVDLLTQQRLSDLQAVSDAGPPQSDLESVVSQVEEAARKSPLFLKMDEIAQVHNRVVALDEKLLHLQDVTWDEVMQHIEMFTPSDPFIFAAEFRNVLKAELRVELITDGFEAGTVEEWRLHNVCRDGDLQAFKEILDQNSQVHGCRDYIVNFEGIGNEIRLPLSPLALAASSGNLELVRYLVEDAGANIASVRNYFAASSDRFEPTVEADHLGVFKYLLEKDPGIMLKSVDTEENTLLHWAADNGLVDIITYLVKEKGLDVNARNCDGESPLFKAAECPEAVKALIDLGANVNLVLKDDSTIAHRLAELGDLETFKFIHQLSPVVVTSGDNLYDSPLCFAANAGHYDLVSYILENCKSEFPNASEANVKVQVSIMKSFVEHDQPQITELLADRGGAKLDLKLSHGSTLLHLAAGMGKCKIAQLLMHRFPKLLTHINDLGELPIDWALKHGRHHGLVRYLASCSQIYPVNQD